MDQLDAAVPYPLLCGQATGGSSLTASSHGPVKYLLKMRRDAGPDSGSARFRKGKYDGLPCGGPTKPFWIKFVGRWTM